MVGCGAAAAMAVSGLGAGTAAGQMESMGDIETLVDGLPTNWGRWGEDDEIGALNLLDSEQTFAGLQAAMRGGPNNIQQYTLQVPMTGDALESVVDETAESSVDAGDPLYPPRTPARRDNTDDATTIDDPAANAGVKSSDDAFVTKLFLHGTTHIDALGHVWYGDQLYNGYDEMATAAVTEFDQPIPGLDAEGNATEVTETRGHAEASVAPLAESGITGRAVLLDVGRHAGDENGWLELGASITLSDLLETADTQGVDVRERDIVLVRTGAVERAVDPDAEWGPDAEPGLTFSEELVEWVHEMDIPLIGADNIAVEKLVQKIDGETYVIPLHAALLRDLGVSLNEILWLGDVAEQCAEDGIYELMYAAAPLHVDRATGAPANPIVLKATRDGDRGRDTDRRGDAANGENRRPRN
ncbi:metal-dependent cyclase [Natronolimnohabitans innermongolicus JCM 12255]|uniref:Metal-dependent cyclase n=2 Tax=Natronolimnohabitans innermongolicus TaxID=253107 RepID=L9WQ31_9EURY|nr:metal-dependent cyclase [Natronolimnohabitans innermongolicus JCM 12255]